MRYCVTFPKIQSFLSSYVFILSNVPFHTSEGADVCVCVCKTVTLNCFFAVKLCLS